MVKSVRLAAAAIALAAVSWPRAGVRDDKSDSSATKVIRTSR